MELDFKHIICEIRKQFPGDTSFLDGAESKISLSWSAYSPFVIKHFKSLAKNQGIAKEFFKEKKYENIFNDPGKLLYIHNRSFIIFIFQSVALVDLTSLLALPACINVVRRIKIADKTIYLDKRTLTELFLLHIEVRLEKKFNALENEYKI